MGIRGRVMTNLEIIEQIKKSVQNALKNDVTADYKHLVVESELIRINFLIDTLLKEGEE